MRKRFHRHLMAYVEHGGLEFPFSESLRTLCRKVLILTKTTEMLLSPSKDHGIEAKEFLNGPERPALWNPKLKSTHH